jgi:hypothetical protein
MYAERNIVARSTNVFTSPAILIAQYNFTRKEHLDGDIATVAGNNREHSSLNVKCPTFLSDSDRILIFSADDHKGPKYKV